VCCEQVFIEHQEGATGANLERELFIIRKLIEREKAALGDAADDFYICSLSNRTIVYKVRALWHIFNFVVIQISTSTTVPA